MALNILRLFENHFFSIKYEGRFLFNVRNSSHFVPLYSAKKLNGNDQMQITICSKAFGTTSSRCEMFNVQDEDDFQQKVVKSDIPVIVDFHANWCGPCKLLGPRLEGIIGGKGDKVHLAKIDIDNVSDLALEYGVSAVPSVLAFKNGKVVDKFIGLQEETRINAFVNKLIGE